MRIGKDGKGYLIEGKNPNIVVYETSFDRAFLDKVHAIHSDPKNNGHRLELIEREKNNLKDGAGNDLGELAMDVICAELRDGCPAYLITSDANFVRTRQKITTADRFPVGIAFLSSYLASELKSRPEEIKRRLEEEFSEASGDVSLDRVIEDIHASEPEYFANHPIFRNVSVPGQYIAASTNSRMTGESLESIFARGATIDRGEMVTSGMSLPMGARPMTPEVIVLPVAIPGQAKIVEAPPVEEPAIAAAALEAPTVENPIAGIGVGGSSILPDHVDPTIPLILKAAPVNIGVPPATSHEDERPPLNRHTRTRKPRANISSSSKPKIVEDPVKQTSMEDTFGYQHTMLRADRELSEKELAERVNAMAEDSPDITHRDVHMWESNRALPEGELYQALVHVLIEENAAIDDKRAAKEKLHAAYERTKSALKAGDAPQKEDLFAFTDALYDLRHQSGLNEESLAKKVAEHCRVRFDEVVDMKLIIAIERGLKMPSLGLMRAIIKALDSERPLADTEISSLLSAYAAVKPGAEVSGVSR